MIVNMGPQHPSTHGVLRLVLELDGETVISCSPIIGYLHTGIEKNTEYRTWQQGVTYVTRMDYLSPFFNELGYCLAVERLLGIEAPPRAQVIRVLFCELNRITSHLVWLAHRRPGAGRRLRDALRLPRARGAAWTSSSWSPGLRMNHAYIRIGGVIMDIHEEGMEQDPRRSSDVMPGRIDEYESLLSENPIWVERNRRRRRAVRADALALGVTGPMLRAAGVPADLRKDMPYRRVRDLRLRRPGPQRAPTRTRATRSGWTRCASRCASSSSASSA